MVIIFFEQQSNFDFKGEKNNIEQCLDLLSSKCKKIIYLSNRSRFFQKNLVSRFEVNLLFRK